MWILIKNIPLSKKSDNKMTLNKIYFIFKLIGSYIIAIIILPIALILNIFRR